MAKLSFPFKVSVPLDKEGRELIDWSELTDEEEEEIRKRIGNIWIEAIESHMRGNGIDVTLPRNELDPSKLPIHRRRQKN